MRNLAVVVLSSFLAVPIAADSARRIERESVVSASPAKVWKAWTTVDGMKTFLTQDAHIELKPGGAYEMYFDMTAPVGQRGGETNRILAIEPERMLLFSWNAPPKFGPLRDEHTYVLLRLDETSSGGTRLRLMHFGWPDEADWNAVYEYFEKAWSWVIDSFEKAHR